MSLVELSMMKKVVIRPSCMYVLLYTNIYIKALSHPIGSRYQSPLQDLISWLPPKSYFSRRTTIHLISPPSCLSLDLYPYTLKKRTRTTVNTHDIQLFPYHGVPYSILVFPSILLKNFNSFAAILLQYLSVCPDLSFIYIYTVSCSHQRRGQLVIEGTVDFQ